MNRLIPLALLLFAAAGYAKDHSASQIQQMIKDKGANKTVSLLYGDDDDSEWYTHVIPSIRTGNTEWLKVASELEPGVDASTAEDLTAVLSEAIPNNPAGVLAILDDKKPLLTIKQVCSFANFPQTEAESNKLFVDSVREMYKVKSKDGRRCLDAMVTTIEHSTPFDKDA